MLKMPQASVLKQGHVQNFLVKMIFYYHANKTHFHKKGFCTWPHFKSEGFWNFFLFGTWKCPIPWIPIYNCTCIIVLLSSSLGLPYRTGVDV